MGNVEAHGFVTSYCHGQPCGHCAKPIGFRRRQFAISSYGYYGFMTKKQQSGLLSLLSFSMESRNGRQEGHWTRLRNWLLQERVLRLCQSTRCFGTTGSGLCMNGQLWRYTIFSNTQRNIPIHLTLSKSGTFPGRGDMASRKVQLSSYGTNNKRMLRKCGDSPERGIIPKTPPDHLSVLGPRRWRGCSWTTAIGTRSIRKSFIRGIRGC